MERSQELGAGEAGHLQEAIGCGRSPRDARQQRSASRRIHSQEGRSAAHLGIALPARSAAGPGEAGITDQWPSLGPDFRGCPALSPQWRSATPFLVTLVVTFWPHRSALLAKSLIYWQEWRESHFPAITQTCTANRFQMHLLTLKSFLPDCQLGHHRSDHLIPAANTPWPWGRHAGQIAKQTF
jgi:hypothetical protein